MEFTENAPIGIIGAMDIEVSLLKQMMQESGEVETVVAAGMEFMKGAIEGSHAIVVKCGVGMVNAAICAEILIDRFKVAAIVNTGVAGSLDNSIEIGDIVIATDAVNHLMDVENLGYKPGQTPGIEPVFLPASKTLQDALAKAAEEIGATTHSGRVASGDRFVRDAAEKDRITTTFDARCCEMEGAAIAQACYLSSVPCAIVRAISDKADGTSTVDYRAFEDESAHRCARLTAKLLEA